MQNAEPVERFNEFFCIGRDVDPEIVTAKVHLERRESALQRRSSLGQADPWRRPCAVHPDRLGEIDDPRFVLMDQDVEGAQVAMDHAGPDETPDHIEHARSRNSLGSSSTTSLSRGAGPPSVPRYRIEKRFSTRRAGVGTRTPPFQAWRIISYSCAARQPMESCLTGPPPRCDVRYSR